MKSHIKACQLVVLILAVSSVIGGDVVDMKPKSNHRLARGAFMDYGMILSSPVTTYLMKLARNAPDQIVKARAMHGLNSNGTIHVSTTTESILTPLLTRKILQEIKEVSYIPLVLLVIVAISGVVICIFRRHIRSFITKQTNSDFKRKPLVNEP